MSSFSLFHISVSVLVLFRPYLKGLWGFTFQHSWPFPHSFSSMLLFGLQTGIISNITQPGTIVHLAQADDKWIYDPSLLIQPFGVTTIKWQPITTQSSVPLLGLEVFPWLTMFHISNSPLLIKLPSVKWVLSLTYEFIIWISKFLLLFILFHYLRHLFFFCSSKF